MPRVNGGSPGKPMSRSGSKSSQRPLFRLLGTKEKEKKHVVYEAGHGDFPRVEEVRESLDWLDKYLGPVRH